MATSRHPLTRNRLYYGDNLDILRRYIKDETVDLIYLDPPFKSNQDYNVLFAEKTGEKSAAQIKAFEDTWEWNKDSATSFAEVVEQAPERVSKTMQAFMTMLGNSDMMAYLSMMAPRLVELRRVLKPTGSIYLHCDPTASHYLKLLMDAIFGSKNFLNEIIWHYTGGGRSKSYFSRKHDTILWYKKGNQWHYNIDEVRVPYKDTSGYAKSGITSSAGKHYFPNPLGTPSDDVWDIPIINPLAAERLGYPTQKPEALLDRIVRASSNENDIVLDPFCGCGTTIAVAQRLKRHWVGIDITHLAISLLKHRLHGAFDLHAKRDYEVIGEPTDKTGAEQLAKEDRYQFQYWALGLVGARPVEQKKGTDAGIDGRLFFHDESAEKTKQIILSVKSGHTNVAHVRDLRGVLDREHAEMGALITLEKPSSVMVREAASAGVYSSPGWNKKYPKLQILTVEELLEGKKLEFPPSNATFKRSQKVTAAKQDQKLL